MVVRPMVMVAYWLLRMPPPEPPEPPSSRQSQNEWMTRVSPAVAWLLEMIESEIVRDAGADLEPVLEMPPPDPPGVPNSELPRSELPGWPAEFPRMVERSTVMLPEFWIPPPLPPVPPVGPSSEPRPKPTWPPSPAEFAEISESRSSRVPAL